MIGFFLFGNALRKQTIDRVEKSIVTNEQSPMFLPPTNAVVFDIWVRLNEYTTNETNKNKIAMLCGRRFSPTIILRKNSLIPDPTLLIDLLMICITPFSGDFCKGRADRYLMARVVFLSKKCTLSKLTFTVSPFAYVHHLRILATDSFEPMCP